MNLTLAQRLAEHLMAKWEVGSEWVFVWSNGKRQLGAAVWSKPNAKRFRRELRMSRHLVRNNGEDEVRDTILHEIAHIKAGHEAGHGPLWKHWARTVGAKPVRCADTSEVKMVQPLYIVVCTLCESVTSKKHRRVRLARRYCRSCGTKSTGKLEMRYNPEAGQVK
jgi:predicted SprT family Zn-dependent metalloprotease